METSKSFNKGWLFITCKSSSILAHLLNNPEIGINYGPEESIDVNEVSTLVWYELRDANE